MAALERLEEADRLMTRLDSVVVLGRYGAPDRLRQLLAMRGLDIGPSRLKTFVPEDVPEEHAAMARDLIEQLSHEA